MSNSSPQQDNFRKNLVISNTVKKPIFIVLIIFILLITLWKPILDPLLENIQYTDEGEYAGRPVYYFSDGGRISLTLHRELEKCGYSDDDVEGFRKSANESTIYQYNDVGDLVATIYVAEITRGVFEIKINCDLK